MATALPNLKTLTLIMRGWDQNKLFDDVNFNEYSEEARQECIKYNLEQVSSLMPGLKQLILETEFHPETDPNTPTIRIRTIGLAGDKREWMSHHLSRVALIRRQIAPS